MHMSRLAACRVAGSSSLHTALPEEHDTPLGLKLLQAHAKLTKSPCRLDPAADLSAAEIITRTYQLPADSMALLHIFVSGHFCKVIPQGPLMQPAKAFALQVWKCKRPHKKISHCIYTALVTHLMRCTASQWYVGCSQAYGDSVLEEVFLGCVSTYGASVFFERTGSGNKSLMLSTTVFWDGRNRLYPSVAFTAMLRRAEELEQLRWQVSSLPCPWQCIIACSCWVDGSSWTAMPWLDTRPCRKALLRKPATLI